MASILRIPCHVWWMRHSIIIDLRNYSPVRIGPSSAWSHCIYYVRSKYMVVVLIQLCAAGCEMQAGFQFCKPGVARVHWGLSWSLPDTIHLSGVGALHLFLATFWWRRRLWRWRHQRPPLRRGIVTNACIYYVATVGTMYFGPWLVAWMTNSSSLFECIVTI